MNVATGTGERFKINMRKMTAYGYYGMRKALRSLAKNDATAVRHVIYYPAVRDVPTLADLINRISWYFPQSTFSQVEVSIPVYTKLLDIDLESLVPPPSQDSYIGSSGNIRLIHHRAVNLSQADAIMLWDKTSMFEPSVLRHLTKVNMVDPSFYYMLEAVVPIRLYFETVTGQQEERISELSKTNYRSLLDEVSGCKKGYVFGTGPSLDQAMELDYRDGFRIICNSIIKNKNLLNHIKPHLLAFLDPMFHFSPCRYAAEFRRMMLRTVEEFHCYIMVREYQVPLLLAHYPQIKNKIIGVPAPGVWDMPAREIIGMLLRKPTKTPLPTKIPGHKEKWNFPTLNKFYVRVAPSVMLVIMVPVVSSVCEEIYIIGADGRKPNENYFWSYSSSSQMHDMMQSGFDTHPSFFRDVVYEDEYNEYCQCFEELVHYGESLGKRYYSLTPSYIPVLAQRLVSRKKE